ncbi:MAG: MBL fold metallo-hydrolase [Actinomycetota bacterium]|nr:MBL fold metallo-hydrolase [Actinomycetota bacterium]
MRITVLGHASLLFQTASERILLDPVLRTSSLLGSVVHQYPRELEVQAMPAPTMLVLTHEHYDHFDPETLRLLPKDVPVVIPPDPKMEVQLRHLGFGEVTTLDAWASTTHGSVRLTATPSVADVTEFGLIVEAPGATFWHMSDAEPPSGASAKIVSDFAPIDVVSVKYQPPDPLLNFFHNMGSSFDRRSTAEWMEHACACRPKLAFPYASGLCLTQDHAWENRYAYPFSPEFVAAVLAERLGGTGRAAIVKPGDVIGIHDSVIDIDQQASGFVRQSGHEKSIEWEPFEVGSLGPRLGVADKQSLAAELAEVIGGGQFSAWLRNQPRLVRPFREWRILYQGTVHISERERLNFYVDFSDAIPEARVGKSFAASYFMHIGGTGAHKLLSGRAYSAELMYQGCIRIYERIVSVRNDRIDAPDTKFIYDSFPDPFLCFANARAKSLRR